LIFSRQMAQLSSSSLLLSSSTSPSSPDGDRRGEKKRLGLRGEKRRLGLLGDLRGDRPSLFVRLGEGADDCAALLALSLVAAAAFSTISRPVSDLMRASRSKPARISSPPRPPSSDASASLMLRGLGELAAEPILAPPTRPSQGPGLAGKQLCSLYPSGACLRDAGASPAIAQNEQGANMQFVTGKSISVVQSPRTYPSF
jgi:hypothetical protein